MPASKNLHTAHKETCAGIAPHETRGLRSGIALLQSKLIRRSFPTHSSTKARTLFDISRACG
jgi:hypothetical protein